MEPPAKSREPDSADARLDALRDHPGWDDRRRDEAFDRIVAGFPPEVLREAARRRLDDLSGGDAEAVLRLVEAFGNEEDRESLAHALISQPDLPPERAWEALMLLEGTGLIESNPALAERWEELADLIEGDASSAELAEQLESDPTSLWVALQALDAIEPAIRAEIIAGLADAPAGPGLIEFLRHLAFAHDPSTRSSALGVLSGFDGPEPSLADAWTRIANAHPDPDIAALARRALGRIGTPEPTAGLPAAVRRPRPVRAVVSAVDRAGRGRISLLAEDCGDWVAASFLCDVERGVVDVSGALGPDRAEVETLLTTVEGRSEDDLDPRMALGLLSGSLLLCGPGAPPALSFWVERTAGPDFRPRPIAALLNVEEPGQPETSLAAQRVLRACPDWADDSELTYRLAEEALLRGEDPGRDAGALRFLFERRLLDRLETLRRMLLWMAALWQGTGADDLARSARSLALQLADPQHAVAGHPFLAGLASRSLSLAVEELRSGVDPRRVEDRRERTGS